MGSSGGRWAEPSRWKMVRSILKASPELKLEIPGGTFMKRAFVYTSLFPKGVIPFEEGFSDKF
jgi:hypothetical protein